MKELSCKFLKKDSNKYELKFFYLQTALNLFTFFLSLSQSTQNIFLPIVYLTCATPTIISSIKKLINKELSIDVLMTTAGIASFIVGNKIEGALLFVLFRLSYQIESNIKKKAYRSFKNSSLLFQRKTFIKADDDTLIPRHIDDISIGTEIVVKGGEIFPLDGTIVDGSTLITTAHLTGESETFEKKTGDHILSGSQNVGTSVVIKTTRTSSQSTLEKIFNLIHTAHENKPKMQTLFEKIEKKYSLFIILSCTFCAILLPYILDIDFFGDDGSIKRALNMLIALSPCSILLAIPISYVSCLSSFAKKGVIIKNTKSIETISKAKKIAIDKTGTLTSEKPEVHKVFCFQKDGDASDILENSKAIIYKLSKQVVHPSAAALTSWCQHNMKDNIDIPMDSIRSSSGIGKGVCASVNNGIDTVAIGNFELISTFIDSNLHDLISKTIQNEGLNKSICICLTDTQCIIFELRESIRNGVCGLATKLQEMGLETIVLTGDREVSAKEVCQKLGPCKLISDLSPSDKLDAIESLKRLSKVIMIGDGINDAPALASADVSIAMGNNNAIAAENSDIILINNCLKNIPWIINKSRQTRLIIIQNLVMAFISIIIGTGLAITGMSSLWFAVMLHEGSTIIVSLNGTRLIW